VIIDARCPQCDNPVRGREEVTIVKSERAYRAVTACPKCKLAVKLAAEPNPEAELCDFYFDFANEADERALYDAPFVC